MMQTSLFLGFASRRWTAACALLLALAGCGGVQLADLEAQRREEARLLKPFEREQVLGVSDAVLTMTANFFAAKEGQPGTGLTIKTNPVVHTQAHQPEPNGGALYTYQSKVANETARPMEFRIRDTLILVENRMQIRILGGRNALTLDLTGSGATLRRDGETRFVGDVDIADGAFAGS